MAKLIIGCDQVARRNKKQCINLLDKYIDTKEYYKTINEEIDKLHENYKYNEIYAAIEKSEVNISWFINSLYDYGITEVKFIFEFIKKLLTNKM